MSTTSTADRVIAIIGMVSSVVGAVVGFVPAMMLAMASDGCRSGCSIELLSTGWYVALIAPPVAAVIGAIVTSLALIRSRAAAKWAWGFLALQAGLYFGGVGLVFLAAGYATA